MVAVRRMRSVSLEGMMKNCQGGCANLEEAEEMLKLEVEKIVIVSLRVATRGLRLFWYVGCLAKGCCWAW